MDWRDSDLEEILRRAREGGTGDMAHAYDLHWLVDPAGQRYAPGEHPDPAVEGDRFTQEAELQRDLRFGPRHISEPTAPALPELDPADPNTAFLAQLAQQPAGPHDVIDPELMAAAHSEPDREPDSDLDDKGQVRPLPPASDYTSPPWGAPSQDPKLDAHSEDYPDPAALMTGATPPSPPDDEQLESLMGNKDNELSEYLAAMAAQPETQEAIAGPQRPQAASTGPGGYPPSGTPASDPRAALEARLRDADRRGTNMAWIASIGRGINRAFGDPSQDAVLAQMVDQGNKPRQDVLAEEQALNAAHPPPSDPNSAVSQNYRTVFGRSLQEAGYSPSEIGSMSAEQIQGLVSGQQRLAQARATGDAALQRAQLAANAGLQRETMRQGGANERADLRGRNAVELEELRQRGRVEVQNLRDQARAARRHGGGGGGGAAQALEDRAALLERALADNDADAIVQLTSSRAGQAALREGRMLQNNDAIDNRSALGRAERAERELRKEQIPRIMMLMPGVRAGIGTVPERDMVQDVVAMHNGAMPSSGNQVMQDFARMRQLALRAGAGLAQTGIELNNIDAYLGTRTATAVLDPAVLRRMVAHAIDTLNSEIVATQRSIERGAGQRAMSLDNAPVEHRVDEPGTPNGTAPTWEIQDRRTGEWRPATEAQAEQARRYTDRFNVRARGQ